MITLDNRVGRGTKKAPKVIYLYVPQLTRLSSNSQSSPRASLTLLVTIVYCLICVGHDFNPLDLDSGYKLLMNRLLLAWIMQ